MAMYWKEITDPEIDTVVSAVRQAVAAVR